ncbi:elongation factor P maturation arginine rhamnosyltransferase EarP [Robbsia sp. Bb-Pol-6]|uniref:Protein-arginine rhamnosyltransferase n=1 Tax=Robbsia betulipollinis TaxID=2981849 RepID=A0ABT3ZPR2_9BURK|nr:elongation factor P maturation arginine rhamnosyltransferase EarP [Robbsia betulipollinis]MCY0388539.1 elongation factor P maturation arginine rhamnosyltransferase EarP [Robbsia betulipollinis]
MSAPLRCDLFCTVIDNYGDAGVCWRLARQLADEYGWRVRLFIDVPAALAALLQTSLPPLRDEPETHDGHVIDDVIVAPWPAPRANTGNGAAPDTAAQVPDVVIEAFACELPAHYVQAMAQRERAPVWINLDYLSAEDWVKSCHLGRSPHPRLALEKTFFFPGFAPGTGGLLRERGFDRQRQAFLGDAAARTAFWKRLDVAPPSAPTRLITLFAYENPALASLLAQWSRGDEDILLLVPEGRISVAVAGFFGLPAFAAGTRARRGRLSAQALPFIDQPAYDRLLWQADLNFVRGEDSFVRAQWAERPFVWHIYPQSDAAHLDKLDAALSAYTRGLPDAAAAAVAGFWRAWNGATCAGGASPDTTCAPASVAPDWQAWRRSDAALRAHARPWVDTLRQAGSLAANLAELVESRLK